MVNVKTFFDAGIARIFLILFWASLAHPAFGASWQWEKSADGERLVVRLDHSTEARVERIGTRTLALIAPGLGEISGTGSGGADSLVETVAPTPTGLRIETRTPAFGYIATRPNATTVSIDIFSNPLGARWKPAPGQTDASLAPPPANVAAAAREAVPASGEPAPVPLLPPVAAAREPAMTDGATASPAAGSPAGAPAENQARLPAAPPPASSGVPSSPSTLPQTLPTPQSPAAVPPAGQAVPHQGGRPAAGAPVRQPVVMPDAPALDAVRDRGPEIETPPPPPPAPILGGASSAAPEGEEASAAGVPGEASPAPTAASPGSTRTSPSLQPGQNGRFSVRPPGENEGEAEKKDVEVPLPDVGEAAPPRPQPELEPVISGATQEPAQQFDKDGNPIPLPPTPAELLLRARLAANSEEYQEASSLYGEVSRMRASTPEQVEEALYGISDAEYALARQNNDLAAQYTRLMGLTEQAMNYNLKSSRVPGALLRLGYLSMLVGNEFEAQAYFNLLRREYPNDELIPSTYYYWGDYFFRKKDWNRAADEFQTIVQKYPSSPYTREAAVALARALYELEYYEQANQIVEYVESRWPHFYTEYPPILGMTGALAANIEKYDAAKSRYWTYYNIDPQGDEADMVLSRIGDIYLKQKNPRAAREVYEETLRRFPDREGGIIALLRLAEEGIHDAPDVVEMNAVFDRPYNLRPVQAYTKILREYPASPLAPLAQLKLSMWYLWNNQMPEAMTAATNFLDKYPKHELRPRAEEVAMRAYDTLVADSLRDDNPNRILQMWDEYPIVRNQQENMPNQTRLALASSQWKSGRSAEALALLEPFFRGAKDGEDAEAALALALAIYMDSEQWKKVSELAHRIQDWELTPKARESLDYSQALAFENLGESDRALALWQRLHGYGDLPLPRRTYMLYFLSRAAKNENDLENAYFLGRDALRGFLELAEDDPKSADVTKIKDTLVTLMDIAERAGRTQEALEWATQYRQYVNPGDEEYPGMQYRFARLYRKNGAVNQWEATLNQIVRDYPESFYGRMAASELRTQAISKGAAKFTGQ